jgi:hypothetical protein
MEPQPAAANSKPARKRPEVTLRKLRSAITNGSSLLADVDHRSAWMRRLRDLISLHTSDLGGDANISEGERSLLKRASMLELQCELMEQRFAQNGGEATSAQLTDYQRAAVPCEGCSQASVCSGARAPSSRRSPISLPKGRPPSD